MVIHVEKDIDRIAVIDRSGKVEQHKVVRRFLVCQKRCGIIQCFFGFGGDNRISRFADFPEQRLCFFQIIIVFPDLFLFPFPQVVNTPLRIIAINDGNIKPHFIVQVTCCKGSKYRFARTPFLRAKRNVQGIFRLLI
jgi:hypothetical protein